MSILTTMDINKLIYGISEDKFFGDNFDIELDEVNGDRFAISSKSDIDLLLGRSLVISIRLLCFNDLSVRFGDDRGSYMKLVYAEDVFRMDKFIYWLKCSLRDFVRQSTNRLFRNL